MTTRVAIIPGNGCGDIEDANWYGWARDKLNEIAGVHATLRDMPDPDKAREKYWIPFMRDSLKCGEDTVIIGHSSGAAAAMRYAERYKVKGIILVAAYVTDLGSCYEKKSGYFDRPWLWEKIKANTGFIVQFGSTDDRLVPFDEQTQVHEGLNSDFQKFTDKGHFMEFIFPELIRAFKNSTKA